MTTTTLNPADSLSSLGLKDGDAMTASVESGRLIVSVHSKDDIIHLESSLDASRNEKPVPLESDLFDRLRDSVRSKI